MEFFDVLNTRRSIRSFLPDPITEEEIATLIKAGSMAPSAMNKQPWHFVVVTDRKLLDQLADRHPYAKFCHEAPLAIVVTGEPSVTGQFWVQDCAAATQNILLAARAMNIASVWCGLYPVQERVDLAVDVLGIPEGFVPFSLIALGRTSKSFFEAKRDNPAKIHHNGW